MTDYLIVGHGLAGACLAAHLQDQGRSIHIIDNPGRNISSIKAAGLYNPVTGRKMVKTWMADKLFPYLEDFYIKLENRYKARFLHPRLIYRPFLNIEEQNDWMGKSTNEKYSAFVNSVYTRAQYAEYVHDPFGGIELKLSGFVDIRSFLKASQEFWQGSGSYRDEDFDFDSLKVDSSCTYNGMEYRQVIFCEGPLVHDNPYFSWLPVQPLKGEVLELETAEKFPVIFNRGVFAFNFTDGVIKAGSTYDRNDQSLEPTEEARKMIESKLSELICVDYKVMTQYAGIRPTVIDRRPIIGLHPRYKSLGVFNGLGTKGVSLGPYFAKQFSEYLVNGKEVAAEVHISRFLNKFIN